LRDTYRLPAIGWLYASFLALAVLLGGWMGLRSVLGLGLSVVVLVWGVMPAIVGGAPPFYASLAGAVVIASTSLFLAHGCTWRTAIAWLSTLVTLAASALLAAVAVWLASLTGTGSEESMFLQLGPLVRVDLRGLLLGGLVIGCLGVLDDITTAQTAVVEELRRANARLTPLQLWQSASAVGREHIASLVNTLALAYVGSSFPLLLLLASGSDQPLWLTLNSEFFAEELVRTFVGSMTLLLAVPVATGLAVWLLPRLPQSSSRQRHPCGHLHTHA
jgi:uncharacterized membrane protein